MRVYVLQPSNIIDLCQLLWFQVQGRKHFVKMLHVLEYKRFCLIKHQHFNVSQEVLVNFRILNVCFIIGLMASKHTKS